MSYASTEIHARRRFYAVYLLYVVTLLFEFNTLAGDYIGNGI